MVSTALLGAFWVGEFTPIYYLEARGEGEKKGEKWESPLEPSQFFIS